MTEVSPDLGYGTELERMGWVGYKMVGRKWSRLDEAMDGTFWCRRGRCVGLTTLSLAARLWIGSLGRTHVGQGREQSKAMLGLFQGGVNLWLQASCLPFFLSFFFFFSAILSTSHSPHRRSEVLEAFRRLGKFL